MNNYKKLSDQTAPSGDVNFIVNLTKNNYVNLRGINSLDVLDSVVEFLIEYGAWNKGDVIKHCDKNIKFSSRMCHNISFILKFYELGYRSQQIKLKKTQKQVEAKSPIRSQIDTVEDQSKPNSIDQSQAYIH